MEDGMKVWVAPQSKLETISFTKVAILVVLIGFSVMTGMIANKKLENKAKHEKYMNWLSQEK